MSVAAKLKADLEDLDRQLPKPDQWQPLIDSGDPQQALQGLQIHQTVLLQKIAGTLMVIAKQVDWIEAELAKRAGSDSR